MTSLIPLILSLFVSLAGDKAAANRNSTINAAIGDISYVKKYGAQPSNSADEVDRIKIHLAYVEQLLLSKDITRLPEATRQKRMKAIALLHEYRIAGNFPSNYDYAGHRPCFIDEDGNICAVGYLVEQTAGRAVAEQINAKHKYDYIKDMDMPELAAWINNSGLTSEECAMIQPQYGWKEKKEIPLGYSISSSVLSGANLVFTGVNIKQSFAGKKSSTLALISLASGVTQAMLGTIHLDKTDITKSQIVSKINIATGATTIVSSLFNLVIDKKPRTRNTSVSLSSFSTIRDEPALGFTLTRKL
ncbi:MAG TPA: hypothetical protein VEB40_13390 [Flavipsychrobacter sp.]|nr:hypothetical protein [Flavipsychrobacter sp.]